MGSYATVAAGYLHTVGLKSDGTVVAVGHNEYGQCEQKHAGGTSHHTRFNNIIKAMYISKSLITKAFEE